MYRARRPADAERRTWVIGRGNLDEMPVERLGNRDDLLNEANFKEDPIAFGLLVSH